MKEKFIDHVFYKKSQEILSRVQVVLEEYAAQNYQLSLRQLFYQLVARGFYENSDKSYHNLGGLVDNARQAGLIDRDMVEDRSRESVANDHWKDPAEIVRAAARSFKVDHWKGQPCYVEVMVEKDALSGILEPVCRRLDVRFSANKGYSSSSFIYTAAKRIEKAAADGLEVHVFYLGDHDPRGIHITQDVQDRLGLFSHEVEIKTVRLALNYDQVQAWKPPVNKAKEKDKLYNAYVKEFGKNSWELDAVDPATLAELVQQAVDGLIDKTIWAKVKQSEDGMRLELEKYAARYEKRSKLDHAQ